MKKILLGVIVASIGYSQFAIHKVDEAHVRKINRIRTIYIKPSLANDQYTDMNERAVLLRLDVLMREVLEGRHSNYKAQKILMLSSAYINVRKRQKEDIATLLEEIKLITDK